MRKPARERRWPAKQAAVRQSFRELASLTGKASPDFLTKRSPQRKIRHAR